MGREGEIEYTERLSAAVGEDERGCSELSSMATLVDKEMLGY